MSHQRWAAMAAIFFLSAIPALAHADGIAVTRGQFTDQVTNMQPVGDAASLANVRTAVYWLELSNDTHATGNLTLIWSVNGHVVHRQALVVSAARTMRTWAFLPLHHDTHTIEVRVVAADGTTQIHTDQTTLADRH